MERLFFKLESSSPIRITRLCFSQMIPLLVIGSFALMLYTIPITPYLDFITSFAGGFINTIFKLVNSITLESISLYLLISFPVAYCTEKGIRHKSFYIFMSVSSYLAYTGGLSAITDLATFKPKWMFIALVTSSISCILTDRITSLSKKKIHKLNEHDFSLSPITFLFGAFFLGLFSVIGQLIGGTDYLNWLPQLFTQMFSNMGRSFISAFLFIFLVHFLWMFGMHGSNILDGVATGFFESGMDTNNALISSGQAATEIYTKSFTDVFVLMGGCGCSLCIVLAILAVSKRKQRRYVATGGLLPCIFNISEMIVFGFPVILNPIMFIPFIITPLVVLTLSSLVMYMGLVPMVTHSVTWTTPVILSGWLATGSPAGGLLQIVNLIIGTLIYVPFIKISDKVENKRYQSDISEATAKLLEKESQGFIAHPLTDTGKYRNSIENLLYDFYKDLEKGKVELFYQPQINSQNKVIGAEALLRWKHDTIGYVAPPMIIAMTKDDNFGLELGYRIVERCCRDIAEMSKHGLTNFKISVNIAAFQLEDPLFVQKVCEIRNRYDFGSCSLFLEMTEREAMSVSSVTDRIIRQLSEHGISMILDDFGMGHNSLTYITHEDFAYIKIDGALTRNILSNQRSGEIVKSLCALAKDLGCGIIAEYVETSELRDELMNLGCNIYQGYLYSPAIPYDEFIKYVDEYNKRRVQ